MNLQFRAEAFNLFNRVQFGYPGLQQGASNFGIVSSQLNNPRLLQFFTSAEFLIPAATLFELRIPARYPLVAPRVRHRSRWVTPSFTTPQPEGLDVQIARAATSALTSRLSGRSRRVRFFRDRRTERSPLAFAPDIRPIAACLFAPVHMCTVRTGLIGCEDAYPRTMKPRRGGTEPTSFRRG